MALAAVRSFHTLAWFTIEACMAYVLYSGVRGKSDRRTGMAAAVVALETLVFAANGFHCPLTVVARNLGDDTGSVTDIYLPRWFAKNLPAIHVPLIVVAGVLHWRNLRRLVKTPPMVFAWSRSPRTAWIGSLSGSASLVDTVEAGSHGLWGWDIYRCAKHAIYRCDSQIFNVLKCRIFRRWVSRRGIPLRTHLGSADDF